MSPILILLIYIAGYICIYAYIKYCADPNSDEKWKDVFFRIFFSLSSWVGVVIAIIVIIINTLINLKLWEKDPPKWL